MFAVCRVVTILGSVLFGVLCFNLGYFDHIVFSMQNQYLKECSYCDDNAHTFVSCPIKSVEEGAVGRWVVPDVGVNVACFPVVDDAQKVTDARYSAAFWTGKDTTYVADHNYQGFNAIKRCEVGTVAYMDNGKDVQEYICTNVIQGYNAGTHLTDLAGNPIKFYVDGGITNYTCNYFKDTITIVQFAPVS